MATDEARGADYLLPERERPEVTKLRDFVAEHESGSARLVIGADESIALPDLVVAALRQVVEAMSRGLAVTIIPQSHILTTQQAADLLGISRPTLIRLLEAGKIDYEIKGTHRRLLLEDVLRYREQRREAQYQFLADTAVDPDDEEDVEVVLARLRRVRQESKRQ
jgi:excisionase family DNA binding protein